MWFGVGAMRWFLVSSAARCLRLFVALSVVATTMALAQSPTANAVDDPPLRCHEPKSSVNEPADYNLRFPAFGTNPEWRDLDLFLPRSGPTDPSGKHPVIVWVHGGAWNDFDHTIGVNEGVLGRLDEGWAIASVDYRTACEDGNAFQNPSQILDIYTATIWLREVIIPALAQHNLNPDRLLLMGGSSGSHLAMLAGMAANNTFLADRLPYMGVVSLFGIYDLAKPWIADKTTDPAGNETYDWPIMARAAAYLLGCDAWVDDCTVNERAAASPSYFFDANDPPFLGLHGRADQLVDFSHAEAFYEEASQTRGTSPGAPAQFRTNGVDSFFELRSTHYIDLTTGQCAQYADGLLGDGDHGCIAGDFAMGANYLQWLANAHQNF
jgi:acetyl esterase/lipase